MLVVAVAVFGCLIVWQLVDINDALKAINNSLKRPKQEVKTS